MGGVLWADAGTCALAFLLLGAGYWRSARFVPSGLLAMTSLILTGGYGLVLMQHAT